MKARILERNEKEREAASWLVLNVFDSYNNKTLTLVFGLWLKKCLGNVNYFHLNILIINKNNVPLIFFKRFFMFFIILIFFYW